MTQNGRPGILHRLLTMLPVAGCFLAAAWHMRYEWAYDESYRHGWLVPFLALYLFSLRWRDRPPADCSQNGEKLLWWTLAAILLPAVWIVREANPEWRLVGIALSLLSVGTAALYLQNTGGTPWMRHFFSPMLFFMASVPWPAFIERGIIESLMPLNAAVAVEVLHWANIPAALRGNLISLPTGTLGVEEACSGIRSLQATIMIAWFVADLLQVRWRARTVIFITGIACALISNAGRTVFLCIAAARNGMKEAEVWHDTAAYAALAVNTLAVLIAGWLVSRRKASVPAPPRHSGDRAGLRVPVRGPLICAAGLAVMIPLTAWWYRAGEEVQLPRWSLAMPVNNRNCRELPIDDRTKWMLRYTRGWSAAWETGDQKPVRGFFFEWENGAAPPDILNVHQPGGCLANLGIHLDRELDPLEITFMGRPWLFRLLKFRDGNRPLFLLYGVHSNALRTAKDAGPFDFSYSNRWESVIRGYRNPGQRLVEVGLWDASSEESARVEFRQLLETCLNPQE